jgi:2'-5' RNA ligase
MRSALVLLVPQAEPIVGALRRAHDPVASLGIGAHVTLLFPFVPAERLDDDVLARLARELAGWAPLRLRFDRVARFPDVAYLALADAEMCAALIHALAAAWPECPPYEGRFTAIIPHLTIAHGDEGVLAAAEREVAPHLPLTARIERASVLVEDARGWWEERAHLPLGTAG